MNITGIQLNPKQPDPVQQMVFNWMPVMFTFLLGTFPAGLVIYWAWNSLLSIGQQSLIMKRQGVDVPLLENMGLAKFFGGAKTSTEKPAVKTVMKAANDTKPADKPKA